MAKTTSNTVSSSQRPSMAGTTKSATSPDLLELREAVKEMKAMLAVSQAENARLHQEMAETRLLLARWQQEAERREEKLRADHQRECESLNALLAQAIGKKQGQKQQHRDQQQGTRQQQEPGPSTLSTSTRSSNAMQLIDSDEDDDQGSFSEVVRRKYRGQSTGKPRAHQQQQQKRTQRRPKVDLIEVTPQESQTWESVYRLIRRVIRQDPLHKALEDHIGIGNRTRAELLRIKISKSADSALVLAEVREIIGSWGVARLVTEMGEVIVSHIDPLVEEAEVISALDGELEGNAGVVTINMWRLSDGTQRARVRLPAKKIITIDGKKVKLGGCISNIKRAPPTPVERLRCYRCLELGHISRDCRSTVDRQNTCIRCGTEGHKAKSCKADIKCAVCGGDHRVGHSSCVRPTLRCSL